MKRKTAKVATIVGDDGAAIQELFGHVVGKWHTTGIRAVGVISEAHGLPDRTCSAGVLRDIVSGNPHPIFLDVAPSGTSCHLDATGVQNARSPLGSHGHAGVWTWYPFGHQQIEEDDLRNEERDISPDKLPSIHRRNNNLSVIFRKH